MTTSWTTRNGAAASRRSTRAGAIRSASSSATCLFAHALNLATDFDDTRISRTIARTATEVCSGEMIQTQRRFDLKLSRDEYFRIIGMKTGSLFACAAELGAVINGAPD